MERIVLDTNALIQSLPSKSKYNVVWKKILSGDYCLCVSNSILNEYEEIIEKLVDVETAKFVINVILNNPFVVFVNPSFEFNLIVSDPDDNKFVDVSIAANAKVIVTDDKHFKVLESIKFPLVLAMRLEDFYQYTLHNP